MNLSEISQLTEDESRVYIESILWLDGPVCPHCGSREYTRMEGDTTRPGLCKCKNPICRQPFTVTMGTIMEDTHLELRKWLMAFHLLCSSKRGFSAKQLQRNLSIGSYRTAWFLLHRIRYAMETQSWEKPLEGIVEIDETYVGGKPRKGTGLHKRGRGTKKTPVMVLVERDGLARSKVLDRVDAKTLKEEIRKHVGKQSSIMTDENSSYTGIGAEFDGGHQTVNHGALEYAKGNVHINTGESFFALVKRGHYRVYHHYSKHHLPRYLTEHNFRWNYRKVSDGERTIAAIKGTDGKRLMYRDSSLT